MLPYERVRAMQEMRAERLVEENERAAARRSAARQEPGALSELLTTLAQGFAFIGYRGRFGDDHPAKPAY